MSGALLSRDLHDAVPMDAHDPGNSVVGLIVQMLVRMDNQLRLHPRDIARKLETVARGRIQRPVAAAL